VFQEEDVMRMSKVAAVLLALVVAMVPAWAQEQRGAIEGIVKDASGGVLPGVTVEVQHASGKALTATTDGNGAYRFPALAPGVYTVQASMNGFAPRSVENVVVLLGQIKTVDLGLLLAGVSETVTVESTSPIIDVRQAGRSTHLTAEQIERLPKGRDFSSLVAQAPGANREPRLGGLSIDGASAGENRYIIDGAEATDLRMGVQGKELVVDFVEEVQVKASGYTAEYGGAMGGVVNVVTKSGTNALRGDVGTYVTSDALRGGERQTLRLSPTNSNIAEHVTYRKDAFTQWEPGFTLGGPLRRDTLWFFASYQPQLIDTDRTVAFSSTGQTRTYNRTDRQHFSSNNVRFQLGSRTTGRFAFNASPTYRTGLLPAQAGSDNPASNFGIDRETPNYSYSGHVDHVANRNLFFGVRGGYYLTDTHDKGVFQGTRYLFISSNVGQPGVPADLQRVTNFANVLSNNEVTRDKRTRATLTADATYYAQLGGAHTFKGGVQLDRLGNDVLSGESGNLVRLRWNENLGGVRGAFGYYQVRSNGALPDRGVITQGEVSVTNIGLYLQDAWTIGDRLTLNLGVRTENEDVPSFTSADGTLPTAIQFDFLQKLAPRVGVAYDIRGDGRWKAYGSWGWFYDIFKLELPRGAFGGDKWLEYFYTLDSPDWPNLDRAGCPPACPGALIQGPIDFRHPSNAPGENTIDPELDPMRVTKFDVGLEHELTPTIAVAARYVHNQVDKAIEDVGALDAQQNEIYKIANPGFGTTASFAVAGTGELIAFPKAVRDYDAVEVSFDKRHSDNWGLRLSYLWSRLHGNYSGLTQSDENGRTSPNAGRNFDYPLMAFDQNGDPVYGPLGTDRPHQAKAQFTYTAPFGTTVGVNQAIESGVPVTRDALFIPGNNFPVQYLGRLSDGRTPVFSQTDLQVRHDFRLGGTQRITLLMNVLNLFDRDTAINRFTTETRAAISVNEAQFYQGIDAQALIGSQKILRDPRFLLDSGFQEPRSIRFGVKWSF